MEVTEEYKLRDRAYVLSRQVEELQLLVQHQASTISRLKQESLDKSRRILELEQISENKAQVVTLTDTVLNPVLQLTSVLNLQTRSQHAGKPASQSTSSQPDQTEVDLARLAENKILSLENEKQFWRRHFEQADQQLRKLKSLEEEDKLLRFNECRDKTSKQINIVDTETNSTYIRNLLDENFQLKEKLSKLSAKVKNTAADKENIENCQVDEPVNNKNQQSVFANKPSPKKNAKVSRPLANRRSTQEVTSSSTAAPQPPARSESLNNKGQISSLQTTTTTRTTAAARNFGGKNVPSRADNSDARKPSVGSVVRNAGKSSRRQVLAGKPANNNEEEEGEGATTWAEDQLTESHSEVAQLRDELTEMAACCCHHQENTDGGQQQGASRRSTVSASSQVGSRDISSAKSQLRSRSQENLNSKNSAKSLKNNAKSAQSNAKSPNSFKSGYREVDDICYRCSRMTCKNEDGVRFSDQLDPTTVHLCQHIRCLQRQVCHLKHGLSEQTATAAKVEQLGCQLNRANREINELRCTNSRLATQKQLCVEENTALKRKLDTLISTNMTQDSKVRKLIHDIEQQRDRYKSHVETLLKDLQTDSVCKDDKSSSQVVTPDENKVTRERRVNFTGVDLLHVDETEVSQTEVGSEVESEVARLQDEVARLQEDAHKSRMEIHKLRRELMDALARKPVENESPSKPVISCDTTGRNDCVDRDINENLEDVDRARIKLDKERQELAKEREILDLKKTQLDAQRAALQKERFNMETERAQASHNESFSAEISNLKKRIYFLEKQLENTENALRTNQNLVTENSRKNLESSGQLLQLKQALSQANRTSDDFRSKLERTEEAARRTADEKNQLIAAKNQLTTDKNQLMSEKKQLISELCAQQDRNAALQVQLEDCKRSLDRMADSARESEKSRDEDRRREERLQELREMERNRTQDISLQDKCKHLTQQINIIREERDSLAGQLESHQSDNESLESRVDSMKSEINSYIDKVKKMEILMTEKETDRRSLLAQYEQLSRDLHKVETINRNLEMQAENMTLEVKAKQADLEAVRAKCQHSDQYIENMIRQNETLKTQIISLNAKVEMLTADLQENRIARDSVLDDLNGVNELAVKLNTDKVELLHKIGEQNSEVEKLQSELASLRDELMSALASVENERHRTKTLEKLVTESSSEIRETVIKELRTEMNGETNKSSQDSQSNS